MDVGDLLERHGKFWVVRKVEPALRTAFVEDQDTLMHHVDQDSMSNLTRLCNPTLDWPTATLPQVRHGRLVTVIRADLADPQLLIRFKDWVRSDEFQIGGALYLNPALGLGFRDRLIATYADGVCVSVDIPKNFQSLKAKAARLTPPAPVAPKPPPVSLLDRLLEEGDDE